MPYEIELPGRRALVTGAGQGVGAAIAHALAAAGATVVVNDVVEERAAAVVDAIVGEGGTAELLVFDVTDWPAVASAIGGSPGLDILVNNAGNAGREPWGLEHMVPFVETDPSSWAPFLGVNLYGVMYCTRAALPAMVDAGWGRIVTVISDAGRTGAPYMAAYATAKAGAAGFCRAIAHEVGRHGVTVNNISLGTIATEATAAAWADTDPEAVAARTKRLRSYVIRRPGEPSDVAGLAVFLASDQASWITGQTYPVNGGVSFGL